MQLFLSNHYSAFDSPKPKSDEPAIIAERLQVRDAFLRLDAMIWPHIENSNWDLHRHRQINHYVSSDHFIYLDDGKPIVNNIEAMWLHYGKSKEQLDFVKTLGDYDKSSVAKDDYYNAFYLHTRIQFYINSQHFGCSLLLATDKNYYDRSEFKRRIMLNSTERRKFFNLLIPLYNKGFIYFVDEKYCDLDSTLNEDELFKLIKKDKEGYYSGIEKIYLPNDPLLDEYSIRREMVKNLDLLYPLYDYMAWRPQII